MRNIKTIFALCIACTLFSFKPVEPSKKLKLGSYGVCSCKGEDMTSKTMKLVLKEDQSFQFIDNTVSDKKLNISGTYLLKGNKIIMKDQATKKSVRAKWKIDNNELCLKSRKGLNFTRLCWLDACE